MHGRPTMTTGTTPPSGAVRSAITSSEITDKLPYRSLLLEPLEPLAGSVREMGAADVAARLEGIERAHRALLEESMRLQADLRAR